MLKAIKSKKAESYIDVAVSLVAIMMVIVLALNVFSFLTLKMDMDYFAREMVKVATVSGSTDASYVKPRYDELVAEVGFAPSYTWKATYYSGKKVQYGNSIQVTISYPATIVGFGVIKIPLTLTATYSGLSQQYWK